MINATFVTAGKAEFTIDNGKGTHFTYRVARSKKFSGLFVSQRDGSKFGQYLGVLDAASLTVRRTAKVRVAPDAQIAKVFTFALDIIANRRALPDGYSVRHVGKCGRCGRKLTDPVSIASGIGPDCAEIMNAERAKTVVDESASIARKVETVAAVAPVVVAPKPERVRCERCAGTGQFITGNHNGQPVGPGGICYRCEGKGYQTRQDGRRNWGYDNYAIGRAARAMFADNEDAGDLRAQHAADASDESNYA